MNLRFLWASLVTASATLLYGLLTIFSVTLNLPLSVLERFPRRWARSILNASGMKIEVEGLEQLPDAPCILVGNHQSFFDVLMLFYILPSPPVFVAKQELFKIPIFGSAMKGYGHIPVDRGNREKAIESIQKGAKQLFKNKQNVVFFPEGTRTQDGQIKTFKKGAFAFAQDAQLPIVPFAISGSFQALPPHSRKLNASVLRLTFLPQIEVADILKSEKEPLINAVREQVVQHYTLLESKRKGA